MPVARDFSSAEAGTLEGDGTENGTGGLIGASGDATSAVAGPGVSAMARLMRVVVVRCGSILAAFFLNLGLVML